ncbi:MAG: VWA domain-containing protein [Planctomycetales bacterium]|nr:VWA domain-containing protein [Planctomycetales bacterium]
MFNHTLAFDSPHYLWLLLLIPVLWLWGYRSLAGLGKWRRGMALALRSLVLTAIVLALADVQYQRKNDQLTVVYLLDQSLSIPAATRSAMMEVVKESITEHRDADRGDRYAVIVFGRDAEVEIPLVQTELALHTRVESLLDPEYTDVGTAIQRAKAIFPHDAARRIVLVTDGNQNLGNAYREARAAADSGVSIDVVPVYLEARTEVSVEKVDLPAGVRRGQPFEMRVVVDNDAPEGSGATVKGTLRIVRKSGDNEQVVAEQEVTIPPGKRVFTIPEEIDQADFYTYEARFSPATPADDGMAQNNTASAFTHIRGRGQVLLIENFDTPGEFDYLVDRLRTEGLEVTVRTTAELFNSLAELQRYDCVILGNVPRSSGSDADNVANFSDAQIDMLVRNTSELGCGLIMIGGAESFGAGGWANTELEKAMPVDFQIKSAKVTPVGALALMMHGGEMPKGNYWMKKIAVESIKLLGSRDYCGLVQWNGTDQWLWGRSEGGVVRVGPYRQRMLSTVDRMTIGDMPAFDGGMKMAATAFAGLPDAAVKHMIIISDGDATPPTRATINALKAQGAKVSTVAVGSHGSIGSKTMQDIATATGGKYYVVKSANALPKIYQREARRIARPLVYEPKPPVQPQVTAPTHEIIRGLDVDALPPINGFVLTDVKQNPLVEVILRSPIPVDEKTSTVLAAWNYGAGKTVALTTDAGHRWATAWSGWDGYDKLFSQIVRWAMRPTGDTGNYTVATNVGDGRTEVIITAMDESGEFLNNQSMAASVVTPGNAAGEGAATLPMTIDQVAPGRYVGSFPSEEAGSYMVVVNPGPGKPPIITGVNIGYSAEYRAAETNLPLLKSLAELPAGAGPEGVFVTDGLAAVGHKPGETAEDSDLNPFRDDLPPAVSNQSIWPWIIVAGSVLFWSDVFVRRVQVNMAWLPPLLARGRDFVLRRQRAAPVPETMSRLRSRKQQVSSEIEGRRAATRFSLEEAEARGTADLPPVDSTRPDAPRKPKPTTPPTGPAADAPQAESYTERLLKAKKKVWDERDQDKKQPPRPNSERGA